MESDEHWIHSLIYDLNEKFFVHRRVSEDTEKDFLIDSEMGGNKKPLRTS